MKDRDRPVGASRRAARSRPRGSSKRGGDGGKAKPARPAGAQQGTGGPRMSVGAWLTHPALAVAIAAVLMYLPVALFDFVRDDHTLIAQNAFMQRDGFLFRLLSTDFYASAGGHSGLWRPAVLFSYWLDGRVSGWSPTWFHLANVLAHAAVAALVTLNLLQWRLPRAAVWLAGLWFAWMPVHHESVAWISGRTDVYSALFVLLALWLDRRARAGGHSWPGVMAVAALTLALLCKEAAVPFVAIVAIAERVEGRTLRAGFRWLLPYLVITALYLVVHELAAGEAAPPPSADAETIVRRQWAAWTMLPNYLVFLWPWFPHSPERWLPLPSSFLSATVISGVLMQLAVVTALVILVWRRAAIAVAVALLWLPLTPLFAIGLANGFLAFGERLLYVPSVGAAWLLAAGVANGASPARPRPLRIATVAVAGVLVLGSAVELARALPMWKSDATMYETMVQLDPRNPKGHVGWAEALIDQGRIDEALAALATAESLDPALTEVHVSRAGIHYSRRAWAESIASAERALALDPNRPEAHRLRVAALLRLRRIDEALSALEARRPADQGDPSWSSLYGQALLIAGRSAEALVQLEHASQWIDDDPSLSFAHGNAALLEGQGGKARRAFERTVALDPRYYDGWLRLATACQVVGDIEARDRALATAARLPEASDGRVQNLLQELDSARDP